MDRILTSREGKRNRKDIKNLDELLNLQGVIDSKEDDGISQEGDHPFDLSQVHSQIADYPDYSEDDQP